MKSVVEDFIKSESGAGCGIFIKNVHAIRIARGLTKMQKKKFKRHGIVPAAFLICLRDMGVVRNDVPIPRGGASIRTVNTIVKEYRFSDEQQRHVKDFQARLRIKKRCKPEVHDAHFACHSSIWQNLEMMKVK